jgi:hypothetical protein
MNIRIREVCADPEFQSLGRDFEVIDDDCSTRVSKLGRLLLMHEGFVRPHIVVATYEDCEEFDQVLRPYKVFLKIM